MEEKKKIFDIKSLLIVIVGTFFVAISFSVFFIPNQIAPGGVSGLATIFNALWGWQVGLVTFIVNIPLFIISWKKHGLRFMILSLIASVLLSVFIDMIPISSEWMNIVTEDLLLSSIFGGVINGLGLGLVIKEGATTGGTDLIGTMITDKFPSINMSWALFAVNFFVIALAVIFLSPLAGLYAVVALFIRSKVMDFVQTGINSAKAFMIISDSSQEISDCIMKKMGRGVTLLNGKGAYSRDEKNIVMCVVRRNQIAKVRSKIKEIDTHAFIIMYDVTKVDGKGFSQEIF